MVAFTSLAARLSDGLIPPGIGKRGRIPRKMMNPEDRLLLLLTWIRHGDKFIRLASLFGISRSYCYDLVMSILKSVAPVAKREFFVVRSHEYQSGRRMLSDQFPDVIAIVDTKVQQCTRPASSFHDAKLYYSFKHNKYGIKTLTVHAMNGAVMYVSDSVPASASDVTMLTSNTIAQEVIIELN